MSNGRLVILYKKCILDEHYFKTEKMSSNIDYAVYAEFSPNVERKPLYSGFNARVFTNVEAQVGASISYDPKEDTGFITLQPGLYHITGSSMVTYFFETDPEEVEQNPGWPTKVIPNGAYSRLREVESSGQNDDTICIGTMCSANMTPSLIDTYYETDKEVQIVFEHQAGFELDDPEGVVKDVYLQSQENDSPSHVFARIAIRKM